ncbi:22588_t:CDS:10 [Dentiscutata erythropus]|uniref:Glutamine synthetase n=1 Tax=Dentiscutata erythropus TaxID=1348616 RepID=A0A9N9CN61_9GLOM|nr:22588_t:CDS:10 [Dentiscutata erythropus]
MTNIVYDREALLRTVSTFPLIDNHCHNLLTSDASLICPLEVCFSKARGDALKDASQTSALKRGVRQLAEVYNCTPTLDNIKQVRDLMSHTDICKTCFEPTGIQCLLLDDGLDALGGLMDVQNHVGFVDVARRIVRIESIAEKILYDLATSVACTDQKTLNFAAFEEPLKKQLETYAKSESVVAFKSIAAYRSGLNIDYVPNAEAAAIALGNFITSFESLPDKKGSVRLVNKVLIDHILNLAIDIAVQHDIPIQFNTGMLYKYSYPYSRQAGYLASVYSNVYVDTGLVFPMISASGQQAILRELLEICPSNKILFSTDGHYLPESFYVAAIQGREALSKVLLESVENGEFSYEEAIKIVKQIMFENSNTLYKLKLTPKQIDKEEYKDTSGEQRIIKLKKMGVKSIRIGFMECSNQYRFHIVPIDRFKNYVIDSGLTIARVLTALPYYGDVVPDNAGVDATGEVLLRPDLSTLIHLPYNPKHANVQAFFENKFTPIDPQFGKIDNSPDSLAFPLCPRTCLKNITDSARKDLGITFLIGTEFEFVLLKDTTPPVPVDDTPYSSANAFRVSNSAEILDRMVESLQEQGIEVERFHSEGGGGQFEIDTAPETPLIAADKVVVTRQTIYDVAAQAGVKATFVPKLFKKQGLFLLVGTGAHVHISFKEIDKSQKIVDDHPSGLSPYERSFIAGVLHHIKAICAFALPTDLSYTRTVDNYWAGSWICWSVENRETPIRVCYRPKNGPNGRYLDVHFEHKFVDATSNPYLVISALIASGVDGIKKEMQLTTNPMLDNPASLSNEERMKKGVTGKMPASLPDTLKALKEDKALINALGEPIIRCYTAVKEEEHKYYETLTYDEQIEILLKRY